MRWLSPQGTRLSQPQGAARIDWSHQTAALFRSGFLASFRHRQGAVIGGPFTSDTTARSASPGGGGIEIKSATAPDTKYTGTVSNWLSGATQATFLCVFTPRSVPSGTTEERLFSRWGVGAGNDQFIVQMYGSNIGVAVRSASFIEARRSSGVNLEAGKLYAAVCTWNASRSSTDRHRFWLNGAALSSVDWFVNGTAASINTSTSPELQFGQDNGGTNRASDVVILAAGAIPVDIGNSAASQISGNPWQLFQPERRIWVPVSESGGFSAAVGVAAEVDTALGISAAIGIGLSSETDAALALGATLSAAVGLAVEIDAAQALQAAQARVVGLATEADTALALAVGTGFSSPVGLAVEADTATALAASQSAAVGLAIETDTALVPGQAESTPFGGYDDDTRRAPHKRKKPTVIHPDTREQSEAEFEALLQRVKGQAQEKAKALVQRAPAAVPSEIKPPRMPEIRGVESALLRQWMPDLLSTYRATFTAELQALASAQQAAAQAQMLALQRQQQDDEEIAILAMLA